MPRFILILGLLFGAGLFSSCGIEDYLFLNPVPVGNISLPSLNTSAVIALPNIDLAHYYYFSHFTIYYRIYISGIDVSGAINEGQLGSINPSLLTDYSALIPYTNTDTVISTSIATLFGNRKYYTLNLSGADMDNVLGAASLGRTAVLDFALTPGRRPTLRFEGGVLPAEYTLYRSTGNGAFSPLPDRFFLNSSELNRSDNVSEKRNNDVADYPGLSGTRYTYVALYILVTGTDSNYTPIYSRPTYVGVFRLPEPY
jgi:hypothetical protein